MNRFTLLAFAILCAVTVRPAAAQPTYAKEVSRIMQEKCHICHQANDIAPFELSSYDDAVTYAEDIQRVLTNRIMPPWKPVAGHGEFKNNFGLTDDERATILSWINSGTPMGDPADLPDAPAPKGDWQLGDPAMSLSMRVAFDVPRVKDLYRCFVMPLNMDSDQWIQAAEVLPGNRQVVHHVILYVDDTGVSEKLDGADGSPGYNCFGGPGFDLTLNTVSGVALGFWVPGMRPVPLPEGTSIRLSKTARVVMQVHYNNPGGLRVADQTRVGLYFNSSPVYKQFRYLPIVPLPLSKLQIPAGDAVKTISDSFTVPPLFSIHAWQVGPHMHLLGRQVTLEAQLPKTKETIPLIYIDNWDFNWQNLYSYNDPIALPSGTTVKISCTYDNSANNPKNPNDPVQNVGWGEGTTDEMCIGFLGITIDGESLQPLNNSTPQAIRWHQ